MSTRTEHYQLHQWVPEDSFLRTDFNEDNAVLDAAIHQTQARADRALQGLIPVSYNVYQLMLQNYYEGKYTGYKKALLFDGFLDTAGIASRDNPLLFQTGELVLTASGQSESAYGYSTSYVSNISSRTITASGNGILTGVEFKANFYADNSTDHVMQVIIKHGSDTVLSEVFSQYLYKYTDTVINHTLSSPITLIQGETYTISAGWQGNWSVSRIYTYGSSLGGTLHITPMGAPQASMTALTHSIPACGTLKAWVRHRGGAVSLSLADSGGASRSLAAGDTTDAVNLEDGSACKETAFSLDAEIPEGDAALSLTVTLGSDGRADIFDYGLILI